MNPLLERFSAERKAGNKAFERLRKDAESKVVRWSYWEFPDWRWDPQQMVGFGVAPERAGKKDASYAYGHDEKGRVVVIHKFSLGTPMKLHSMEFLRYSGDKIIGSMFLPEAVLSEKRVVLGTDWNLGASVANVFECLQSNGRIVRVEELHGAPACDWKTIVWKENKVVSVFEGMRGRKAHRQINYSESGKELEDLDLSKPIKRKPLPKGVTMKSLAKEIRQRLANAVAATVTKAKIKAPVYCLVLNYDCEGNPLLLPELGIGLESERQEKLKENPREARWSIWVPEASMFSVYANSRTALNDPKLDKACELYNRECEYKDSDEPARKLILQVAADLAKLDWKGKLNMTDDFIVFAVDTYGNDLKKNLKLSVPPKTLARLKKAKYL